MDTGETYKMKTDGHPDGQEAKSLCLDTWLEPCLDILV